MSQSVDLDMPIKVKLMDWYMIYDIYDVITYDTVFTWVDVVYLHNRSNSTLYHILYVYWLYGWIYSPIGVGLTWYWV